VDSAQNDVFLFVGRQDVEVESLSMLGACLRAENDAQDRGDAEEKRLTTEGTENTEERRKTRDEERGAKKDEER